MTLGIDEKARSVDVAVVGGGPAGIGACLALSKLSDLEIALFEGDHELGGMPRSCHIFFGMRDLRRAYTGPAYARRLSRLIRNSRVNIYTEARVLKILAGDMGDPHMINVISPKGLATFQCRFLLLATGCFESPRPFRRIPGTRPAGIFTTGTLQQLVNLLHIKPGKRALIIGSEHVSLSCVLTLRQAGISIAGLVEENPEYETYPFGAKVMSRLFGFPIFKNTSIRKIVGDKRVEGVELLKKNDQSTLNVTCDTVIITGRFQPDAMLIDNTPIELDPFTMGPVVNMNFMTSVQNIFAVGNLLRGADMHDLCALEGRLAALGIIQNLKSQDMAAHLWTRVSVFPPIRYAVPQRIAPSELGRRRLPGLFPWPAIQLEKTLKNKIVEAWSGGQMIWKRGYSRLIGHTRIPLPVEEFDWEKVNRKKGIILRVNGTGH